MYIKNYKKRTLEELENTVSRLKASKSDSLGKFGSWARKLKDLIDTNKSKFRVEPIGPVGTYVKLNEGMGVSDVNTTAFPLY